VKRLSFVISAPSGTGKTTIIQRILAEDPRYEFVVSSTTRPRRANETEGKNYYYLPEDEFRRKVDDNEFIEWAFVHQHYYGVTKKEIDRIRTVEKIPLFDVDVQGARNLKKKLADGVFIFIVPPSLDVLRDRLNKRKTESEEQIAIRLRNAVEEMKSYSLYHYIVVNENIDESCNCIKAIMTAESCVTGRCRNRIIDMIGGIT